MTLPATEAVRRIRGIDLYELRLGTGPATVVLHGGPGASHDYLRPGFDAVARGRSLIFYDQRGGGRSAVDRDVPVGWKEQVADLESLRQEWGLEQLTIAGYSWGALLGMLYAVHHAERVAALALISPAPTWRAARLAFETEFARRNLLPDLQAERKALRESGLREEQPQLYSQRLFELSVQPYFFDSACAADLTPFRIVGRTQKDVWSSLGEYDLRSALKALHVDSLVMHGEDDPIPLATAETTASLLGAEFHALERCGHVPYVERHSEFVRLLDGFLPAG